MLTRAAMMLMFGGAAASFATGHTATQRGATGAAATAGAEATESADDSTGSNDCDHIQVKVGYDLSLPFHEADPRLRSRQVLEQAFPAPCFELTFASYPREALVGAVSSGSIDIGLLALRPKVDDSEEGSTLPEFANHRVETVPLVPSSYSVVTKQKEGESEDVRSLWQSIPFKWLALPLGGIVGVLCLSGVTLILNHTVPSVTMSRHPDGWPRPVFGAMTRIDSRLTRIARTWHWLTRTPSGLGLASIWMVLGVVLTVLVVHREAVVHPTQADAPKRLEGAQLAAHDGNAPYELRGASWRRCDRPLECLMSYQQNRVEALAGDRDLLCDLAKTHGATRLTFDSSTAVPIVHAYLRRSEAPDLPFDERQATLRRRLDETLRELPLLASPWKSCAYK